MAWVRKRGEIERFVLDPGDDFGRRGRAPLASAEVGKAGVAGDAAGVAQQMANGNGFPRLVRGRDPARGRVVERELFLFDELEDRCRGEGLGDGGEAELGVGRVGDVPLAVGEAVGFREDDFAVAGGERGAGEVDGLEVLVDRGGGILSECRGGEDDGGEKTHTGFEHNSRWSIA